MARLGWRAFVFLALKIHPEGRAAGVIRGVVGAVDGGIGAAGHRAGVEDKGLVEDIQTDSGSGKETLFRIRTCNQSKESPAGMAAKSDAAGYDMHIAVREGRIETEVRYRTVGTNVTGAQGDIPSPGGCDPEQLIFGAEIDRESIRPLLRAW